MSSLLPELEAAISTLEQTSGDISRVQEKNAALLHDARASDGQRTLDCHGMTLPVQLLLLLLLRVLLSHIPVAGCRMLLLRIVSLLQFPMNVSV